MISSENPPPSAAETERLIVKDFQSQGAVSYQPMFDRMQAFTDNRIADSSSETADEIWLLQHEPVFTQGQAGSEEHVVAAGDIPVVQIDRGGQVTYHGPGQLVVYLMIDIRRRNLGVREFVSRIEDSIIATLEAFGIRANARTDAPGVYVDGNKIASLGLKVRRGCSYHGLALNVDMEMEPWQRINPCGLGVPMTQISDLAGKTIDISEVSECMVAELTSRLGYNGASSVTPDPLPR